MNMHHLDKMADLDQAQLAMAKLLPKLPQPRPIEQLDERGVSLPKIGRDSTALPVLEYPRWLLGNLGPLTDNLVPDTWKPAHFAHKLRSLASHEGQNLSLILRFCWGFQQALRKAL